MKYKQIIQHQVKSLSKKPSKFAIDSYIVVDKRFLHLNDKIDFNLFYLETPSDMSLLVQANSLLEEVQIMRISNIKDIYASKLDRYKYEAFKNSHLEKILNDTTLTIDEKSKIIYESTARLTRDIFNNPTALDNVQLSKDIVNPILKSVLQSQDTIASYIKIITYDYYTHTHSLNVSIYALCLGVKLGLDEKILKDLGRSALLHDLGKSRISHNIVNKDEKLTTQEHLLMRQHPVFGYEIARALGIKNKNILDGIRHHHEKLDGQGYPDSLKANAITLFPRIIGICDIFDALTTRRSYKEANSSYDALHTMKSTMTHKLDTKILNSFISILHQ